jgi:hypothetical protein
MTIHQEKCNSCGAYVFSEDSECRYCHAPLGHEIKYIKSRSPLPTTPAPYPKNQWCRAFWRKATRQAFQQALQINQQRFMAEAQRRMSPNLGGITQQEIMNGLFYKYIGPGIRGAVWQHWWDWNYTDDGPQLVWRYRYWWPQPQPQ